MEFSNKVVLPKEIIERLEYVVLFKDYSPLMAAQYVNHFFPDKYSILDLMGAADLIRKKNKR